MRIKYFFGKDVIDDEDYQKSVDYFYRESGEFDEERLKSAVNFCQRELTLFDRIMINIGVIKEPARLRGYKARLENLR